MSDFPADWVEDHVFDVFRVTGFFGNKPKPGVGRMFHQVLRQMRALSPAAGITVEQVVDGLKALEARGFIRLDPGKSTAYLTDAGHARLSEAGFHERTRAAVPDAYREPPKDEDAAKAASIFAVAFASLTHS